MGANIHNWHYRMHVRFDWLSASRTLAFRSNPNEVLIQTSFNALFAEKINSGLPLYLTTLYKFFGMWLITIGSLLIGYVYVTRLGTKVARNSIL